MTQAAPPTALRARVSETYARESREAVEQQWIVDHLPLVRHVVSKIVGSLSYNQDVEDLISAGTLGLVKAARRLRAWKPKHFVMHGNERCTVEFRPGGQKLRSKANRDKATAWATKHGTITGVA